MELHNGIETMRPLFFGIAWSLALMLSLLALCLWLSWIGLTEGLIFLRLRIIWISLVAFWASLEIALLCMQGVCKLLTWVWAGLAIAVGVSLIKVYVGPASILIMHDLLGVSFLCSFFSDLVFFFWDLIGFPHFAVTFAETFLVGWVNVNSEPVDWSCWYELFWRTGLRRARKLLGTFKFSIWVDEKLKSNVFIGWWVYWFRIGWFN